MSEATFSLFPMEEDRVEVPKGGKNSSSREKVIIGAGKWGKCLTHARYQITVQMVNAGEWFGISV
jgi:hypothetical protein